MDRPRCATPSFAPSSIEVVFCAFESDANRRPVRRVSVPPEDLPRAPDPEALRDHLFGAFNHGGPSGDLGRLAREHRTRSLSCGDVVVIDGKPAVCADMGWHPIPSVEAWLAVPQRERCWLVTPDRVDALMREQAATAPTAS
jgi:hypothetical protein